MNHDGVVRIGTRCCPSIKRWSICEHDAPTGDGLPRKLCSGSGLQSIFRNAVWSIHNSVVDTKSDLGEVRGR